MTINELSNVLLVTTQVIVLILLMREGRNLSYQRDDGRRDTLARIAINLGDIYKRYLLESRQGLKDNLVGQMRYLLGIYDQLSKRLPDRQEDQYLNPIRQICGYSKEQE